jgi:hypothetical protein
MHQNPEKPKSSLDSKNKPFTQSFKKFFLFDIETSAKVLNTS